MTVIVATRKDNVTTITADSAVSGHNFQKIEENIKLFSVFSWTVGISGTIIVKSLFKQFLHDYVATHGEKSLDINSYIEFVHIMRQFYFDFLPKFGIDINQEGEEATYDNDLIISCPYGTFIASNLYIEEVVEGGTITIGSGQEVVDVAMGLGHSPREAVEAACLFTPWCALPVAELKVIHEEREVAPPQEQHEISVTYIDPRTPSLMARVRRFVKGGTFEQRGDSASEEIYQGRGRVT